MRRDIDPFYLKASLDDVWRTPGAVKHKFKLAGDADAIAVELDKLAIAGEIEQQHRPTGGVRCKTGGRASRPLTIELYRRRQ